MIKMFEDLLSKIDTITIPEEASITMNQAKEIVNRADRSLYGCINDSYKIGYLIAQKGGSKSSSMIEENFIQFIRICCCDALAQDAKYMKLQSDYVLYENEGDKNSCEDIHAEMESRAEEICFITGFNAAVQLIMKGVTL